MMSQRDISSKIKAATQTANCIILLGPKGSGKTTLCKQLFPHYTYVNLKSTEMLFDVKKHGIEKFLQQYLHGAIFDNVHHLPEMFDAIQEYIEKKPNFGPCILVSSQKSLALKVQKKTATSDVVVFYVLPFSHKEILQKNNEENTCSSLEKSLFYGSFPSLSNTMDMKSYDNWFSDYVRHMIATMHKNIFDEENDQSVLEYFVRLCAGRSSSILSTASLAQEAGIRESVAEAWLDALENHFVIFFLPAISLDTKKATRFEKKMYFYDTGLVSWLLRINDPQRLISHHFRSSLFENWVVLEVLKIRYLQGIYSGLWHYSDHLGNTMDLIIQDDPLRSILVNTKDFATLSYDFLKRPQKTKSLFNNHPEAAVRVVYAGESSHSTREGEFVSWQELDKYSWVNSEKLVDQYTSC